MPELVDFNATTPVVVPATQEVVYDKYWITKFNANAPDPNKPVKLVVCFAPYRIYTKSEQKKDENGVGVVDGDGNPVMEDVEYREINTKVPEKRLVVNNLFGMAEADANVGAVMNGLFTIVNALAVAQGVI